MENLTDLQKAIRPQLENFFNSFQGKIKLLMNGQSNQRIENHINRMMEEAKENGLNDDLSFYDIANMSYVQYIENFK